MATSQSEGAGAQVLFMIAERSHELIFGNMNPLNS